MAIALTLVAIHFAIATLSGSSVNPARSIGSALVGGDLSQLWIYIVGPIVGGVLGYGIFRVIDEDDPRDLIRPAHPDLGRDVAA